MDINIPGDGYTKVHVNPRGDVPDLPNAPTPVDPSPPPDSGWGTYISPEEAAKVDGPIGNLGKVLESFFPRDPSDPDNTASNTTTLDLSSPEESMMSEQSDIPTVWPTPARDTPMTDRDAAAAAVEEVRQQLLDDLDGDVLPIAHLDTIISRHHRGVQIPDRHDLAISTIASLLAEQSILVGDVIGGDPAYIIP
jgi:hypothetical protein